MSAVVAAEFLEFTNATVGQTKRNWRLIKKPIEIEPDIWSIDMDRLRADLAYAEDTIESLFIHVSSPWTPFIARQLFNLYAPPLRAREMQLYENVKLYWQLINMTEPNISQLAKRLSEKPRGPDRKSLETKIRRATKNKKVRNCLWNILFEMGADMDVCNRAYATYVK